nr:hypothetical protein [Streptomyces sp. NRRL S-1448]
MRRIPAPCFEVLPPERFQGDDLALALRGVFLGLREGPVERGNRRGPARVLAGLDGEFLRDVRDRDSLVLQGDGEGEHVLVDDLRPPAVVALGCSDDLAFQGLLPDVVALDLPGDGEHGEEHRAHTARVVDANERAREEFELDTAGLELGGERHQLGRVAREPLELVDSPAPHTGSQPRSPRWAPAAVTR